jgi:hypothetical protein
LAVSGRLWDAGLICMCGPEGDHTHGPATTKRCVHRGYRGLAPVSYLRWANCHLALSIANVALALGTKASSDLRVALTDRLDRGAA